ncbi:hypothetical protein ASF58_18710 [Methylobacterium sp. Leaf125]|uniref:hypothetical protein n=1 Tax=Methylobacterium sp. Leaf125 TaxID=1736265 RepID=UPI000701B413|nr:hypothetical protein [Methylobacterium sp. Leaf125]KQQ45614.1 hypothetical protein ASF58_18710 [Methylobacterium sp. Leaf125]
MQDRRAAPWIRSDHAGRLTLDKPVKIACRVDDVSRIGVRITRPDAASVPRPCLPTASPLNSRKVFHIVRPTQDMLGALFRCRSAPGIVVTGS